MSLDYTTTALIANTKRRILTPSAQTMFPDASIVEFLNDALQITLVPEMKAAKEEFFVVRSDVTLVAGTDTYDIPVRSFAGAVRDVSMVDNQGNESFIPQLTPMDLKNAMSYSAPRQLYGFYWEGNRIRLTPVPTQGVSTLRLRVERRPNNLILTTQAMIISSINTGLNQITVNSVPTGIYAIGASVDFIKATPFFDSRGDDYAITNIAGTTFTFSSLPAGLTAGDYVALAGYSPVPQIPYEGMLCLCQIAAADMLAAMGDDKAEAGKQKAREMVGSFIKSLSPRVEGTLKKITNRNGIFENGSLSRYW